MRNERRTDARASHFNMGYEKF